MKGQQGGPIHSEPEGGQRSNSLEDVAREPQATPGLQQLTWIFSIQLQVLNGVDDLGMHVPDSARWKGRGRRQREWGELNGEGKVQEPNTNVVNRLSGKDTPSTTKSNHIQWTNAGKCVKFEKALNLVNYSFKLQWWIHAVVTLILTWRGVKTGVGTPLSKGLDSCTGSLTTRIRTTGGQTGRTGAGSWGCTANSTSTNQEVNSLP